MESKVSEGGLNVTLTIRLLMHGKVTCGRGRHCPPGLCSVLLILHNLEPTKGLHVHSKSYFP